MTHLIIGHGGFASGTKATAEFLIGQRDDVLTLDEDIGTDILGSIRDVVEDCAQSGLTVYTDTPESSAHAMCRQLLQTHAFRLIGGYNIAILLESLLADEMTDAEVSNMVEEMKGQLVYVNDLLHASQLP